MLIIKSFIITLGAFGLSMLVHHYIIKQNNSRWSDSGDANKPQRFHTTSTPRMGGLGIFISSFLLLFIPEGIPLFIAGCFAFLSGILEDLHIPISPSRRLLFQLIAAAVFTFLTGSIITYVGLGIHFPYIFGVLFTLFAIVGAMNAINIIDGFNGLSGITSLCIFFNFSVVAFLLEDTTFLLFGLLHVGALMGFLLWNFPGGKIFLGDGGAYYLGSAIAIMGISLVVNHSGVSPWFILSSMAYPVIETLFSIVRKKLQGKSPLEPDREHLHMLVHEKLTQNNPKTTVLILSIVLPMTLIPLFFFNSSIYNLVWFYGALCVYVGGYWYLMKKTNTF